MNLGLHSKIILTLLIIFSLLGVTAYCIHSQVLLPSFLELEEQQISADVRRIVSAFKNEQEHLSLVARDWSAWDDTYTYVTGGYPEFETSSLVESTFSNTQINLFFLLDRNGNKVWGGARGDDFATPVRIEPFDVEHFSPDFPLLQYSQEAAPLNEQQVSGLLLTSAGPMFCVAMPIIDSHDQGPPHGTLIMGRILNSALVEKISKLTGISYQIRSDRQNLDAGSRAQQGMEPEAVQVNYPGTEELLSASTFLDDLYGVPVMEIIVSLPRQILAQGLTALRVSQVLLGGGVIVSLAILLLMLERAVVTPIQRLEKGILKRYRSDCSPKNLKTKRSASREIHLLAERFNQLLDNLDAKNEELADANRALNAEAEKLKAAEARLKDLDQLKSGFISTAAHELRTPVACIMGYTEILSSQDFGAFNQQQREESLREIYENSERLTKLVDDILDISRIEAGRQIPLDKQPASLRQLLEKVVKRLKIKNHHRLTLEIHPDVPAILEFDTHRIDQVMENLLSNAFKYSSHDSTVAISAEMAGDFCQVTVSDQGIGMSPEQVSHIFDKFYRADASNTAIRGLGLGMCIAKQIIEDHGCRIWVESVLGQGTRICFTLQVAEESHSRLPTVAKHACL
ncbi:MAG: CHASE4 domain-containing protein [Desulfuromonadaceae bacterium]